MPKPACIYKCSDLFRFPGILTDKSLNLTDKLLNLTDNLKQRKHVEHFAASKSATKVIEKSESSQPKPHLFMEQLEVDVAGTIVVMIGRVWDVNAIIGRYLSTDFVVSDSKGNKIHCTAKSNVAHNFLRLKEGMIYTVKNFVVLPNKDELWIFKQDMFMFEFDGETITRKVSADPHGYLGYPFQGQSLRVTLWGGLGDVLVERKTQHVGTCVVVLIVMSAKDYNNKLYLSSSSSIVIYDDDDIPCLQELKTENICIEPTKVVLAADCSLPKQGTLKNLLIWARSRKNNTATFHCKDRLEVVVADDTAHTIVVMFNDTSTELLKFSAESLMGGDDDEPVKDGASSSTPTLAANEAVPSMKRHGLEDSDVDEVSGPADKMNKRKRYIEDESESV
nr:hypothetical protein [Tanacetum cinerariifolium]